MDLNLGQQLNSSYMTNEEIITYLSQKFTNLKDLRFENNKLITAMQELHIDNFDLYSFLCQNTVLQNDIQNLNTKEFITIVKIHLQKEEQTLPAILKRTSKTQENGTKIDYLLVTDEEGKSKTLYQAEPIRVQKIYEQLKEKMEVVTTKDLNEHLKLLFNEIPLGTNSEKKLLMKAENYFRAIDSEIELKIEPLIEYEQFIYELNLNENYLLPELYSALNQYRQKMYELMNKNKLTINQENVLKRYQKIIRMVEEKNKPTKELEITSNEGYIQVTALIFAIITVGIVLAFYLLR